MKIRNQLVGVFFVFAVIPMAAIVVYNYVSSAQTLRQAVAAESAQLAADMERRMDGIGAEVERRVERISGLPFSKAAWVEENSDERRALIDALATEFGEDAPLVESFEFRRAPVPPAATVLSEPEFEIAEMAPRVEVAEIQEVSELEDGSMVIDMREVMAQIGDRLTDVPGMVETFEENLGDLPEGVDREELIETATAGLTAVSGLVTEIQSGAEYALNVIQEQVERAEEAQKAQEAREVHDAQEEHNTDREKAEQALDAARLRQEEAEMALAATQMLHRPFVREFKVSVEQEGREVGAVMAKIRADRLLKQVLSLTRRRAGEVPFALDRDGNLIALNQEDEELLQSINLGASQGGDWAQTTDQWVVVTHEAPGGELSFGIASPIRESLEKIRRTTWRNLGFGSGLIGIALLGILPLSRRLTRDLGVVTGGAERIAQGDLDARVEVRSKSEIGQLANAFNHMAGEVQEHQARLLEESTLRRDQEVGEKLLRAEFERKSMELEDAREFQLSLLPKKLPQHDSFEVAVFMRTATEVGGDYYDFRLGENGVLTSAIGDATGHGARAGTMVTAVKSLFSALAPSETLTTFLSRSAAAVRRMELGRMAMALLVVRLEQRQLSLISAGMPPALLWRARSKSVEEIALAGMPLGGLEFSYREHQQDVESGDTLLLMSDGFPELVNPDGDPLGYDGAARVFGEFAEAPPEEIIKGLARAVEKWAGPEGPGDDVTFVVLRIS